jgi:putative transposase
MPQHYVRRTTPSVSSIYCSEYDQDRVVQHFAEWAHGSYLDIQQPPKRYRIINIPALVEQVGFNDITRIQQRLCQWLNEELTMNNSIWKKAWTKSLTAGIKSFVENVHILLGTKATDRKITEMIEKHALGEQTNRYNTVLAPKVEV